MKPRVLVCVLTGIERHNWINPDLSVSIFQMAHDSRFDVHYFPVRDARPWEAARNLTIHAARESEADWLLSFDNDNATKYNPLDIISAAGKDQHVIGVTYGTGADAQRYQLFPTDGHGATNGNFREETHVAGGVLCVRSTVWQRIPKGPWFRWQHAENQVLAPGPGSFGEDVYFCRLVQQHGFKVWSYRQPAAHFRTVDITGMVCELGARAEIGATTPA